MSVKSVMHCASSFFIFVDFQPSYMVVARRGLLLQLMSTSRLCQAKETDSFTSTGSMSGRNEYREKDVNWEVVPISNKELGIRDRTLLPEGFSGFEIIFEPTFTSPHGYPGYIIFSRDFLKF